MDAEFCGGVRLVADHRHPVPGIDEDAIRTGLDSSVRPDPRSIGLATKGGDEQIEVKTSLGGVQKISPSKVEKASRGGKGREVIKRGSFVEIVPAPIEAVPSLASEGQET